MALLKLDLSSNNLGAQFTDNLKYIGNGLKNLYKLIHLELNL